MITRIQLDNGMTVLAEEQRTAPVAALQAWLGVGSADETAEEAGLAHLHEHMLFKGTKRRGVAEIASEVESAGGEINAWTSFDNTAYHVVMAASELGTGIDILADALQHSVFDPDELEREIEVVVEEIRRSQDSPARRVTQAIFDTTYSTHPYRLPVIGTVDSVRSFTRDQILHFYGKHYAPNNVTFVAVGDFDTRDLVAQLEEAFGDWKPNDRELTPRPEEPTQAEPRFRTLAEDVKEARLSVAWHGPELRHDDCAALDLLSLILGGGESSRLFQRTRHDQGLANSVHAYAYTPKDPGLLMVGASLPQEQLTKCLQSMGRECGEVRRQLVTAEELEAARATLLSDAAYQKETAQGQARKRGFFQCGAGDYRYEDEYLAAIRQATADDVRAVAERTLTEAPSLVAQAPELGDGGDLVDAFLDGLREAPKPKAKSTARPEVERIDLPHGAKVLLLPEEAPVVAIRAVAPGGLRLEGELGVGLGFLASMVWGERTRGMSMAQFSRRCSLLGGAVSSFAGRNSLGLRGEFVRERGHEGLELFLRAMLEPAFDPDDVARERDVILERIRAREDQPAGIAMDTFLDSLFPTHPYGRRITGTAQQAETYGADDVRRYFDRFVEPSRFVVVMVGGFDRDTALAQLSNALERSEQSSLPSAPSVNPRPDALTVHRELDKQQTHVVLGGMGTTIDDPARYALEVATTILSGQSGRLFSDLRDRQSLAYSVSATSVEGLDPGYLLAHMATAPDKVEQATAGLRGHFEKLRSEPVSDAELARAKRYLAGTHAIELQRCGARAMVMAMGELTGMGYDHHVRYPDLIRQVTADDVQAAAERFLDPDHLLTVTVGKEPSAATE